MAYRIIGSPTAPGWERDFFSFILNWLDDNDYIEQETSGTTGDKKLIRLSKKGMLYSAAQTCDFFKLGPLHRALLCLPVKYIAGKMMIVRAFYSGMNLTITPPGGHPLKGHEETFDFTAMVPMQVMNSLAASDGLSRVKKLIIGGGEISPVLEHQLQEAETDVYATYGMTETASHVALRKVNGADHSSFFKVFEGIDISLDKRGCLLINAPYISEKPIITNDLAELKGKHQFAWLGRIDNLINSGGIKFSPEHIEQQLGSLILQPFVISSLPDAKLGERIVLVIEGDKWEETHIRTLKEDMNRLLEPYSRPKKILFIKHFPRTETGKINRNSLHGMLRGDVG